MSATTQDAARRELLLRLYRQLYQIRRFEEASAKAYTQGKIGGFLHLGIGQEAVAVGAIAALRDDDWIVATYREHAHCIARGTPLREVMAELFGKAAGCARGRGGSMHLFEAKRNFLGGHAIVGGHIPLAVGAAFAARYRGEDRVAMCFFGDGSASQGAFHEGLWLAALWKLPVVFICENNLYAMGTALYRSLSVEDVTAKALAYGIERDRFDGVDVLEIRDRIKAAVDRARKGEGPTLVEIRTYRFRGHSMADPAKYRTKDEVELWKKRDALPAARRQLVEWGVTEDELIALEAACETEVGESVRFADASPEPPLQELYDHVYA